MRSVAFQLQPLTSRIDESRSHSACNADARWIRLLVAVCQSDSLQHVSIVVYSVGSKHVSAESLSDCGCGRLQGGGVRST